MLSVDLVKQIVFEYRGIDAGKISPRCRKITREDVERYAIDGYRFYDLSEFVIIRAYVVMGNRSWKSRADADYEVKRLGLDKCEVRRVVDVMEML